MRSTALAPSLLVAMDSVVDPNFRRSVVLLVHHAEDEGAFGLILNRRTEVTVAALCESIDLPWNGSGGEHVDWGGPVQPDHGWLLLGEGPETEEVEEVTRGIRFSRSQNVLREVAEEPPGHLRVFLGYAGWGAGQLEREIAEGSWLVVPVSRKLVFETGHERLWEATVRSLGIEPATLVASQGVN